MGSSRPRRKLKAPKSSKMPRRRARGFGPALDLTSDELESIDKLCRRWELITSYRRDLLTMRERVLQDLKYPPAGDDPVVNGRVTSEARYVAAAIRRLDSALLRSKEVHRGAFTDELEELLTSHRRSRAATAHELVTKLIATPAAEWTSDKILEAAMALGIQDGLELRKMLAGARTAESLIARALGVDAKTVNRWLERR